MRFFLRALPPLLLAGVGCGHDQDAPPDRADGASAVRRSNQAEESDPGAAFPQRVEASHLPNAWRLHEKVISGGQPEGDAGFRELQQLGVKTVISVDGLKPDVVAAKKHGLRYVHLPHGYDGVPEERGRELAGAVRDLPGPIYIHCHHGLHRSPAAATVACVGAGFLKPDDALAVLKAAGTSENYRGLYQSAGSARRFDDALLDGLQVDFRESVELPPMAQAMVAVESAHDRLKIIARAGWRPTAEHPDLDPPHEALLLREHFTELLRTDDVRRRPGRFQQLLRDGEQAAREIEAALQPPITGEQQKRAHEAFERVNRNCAACHRAFRDVPLGEKQK